jgi:hypothetical protein
MYHGDAFCEFVVSEPAGYAPLMAEASRNA